MEHINNDMNDLFQKAGDLYPLKTTKPDWETVLGKLETENPGNDSLTPAKLSNARSNKRRWLLLLLLLPISLAGILYVNNTIKQTGKTKIIAKIIPKPNDPVTKNNSVKAESDIKSALNNSSFLTKASKVMGSYLHTEDRQTGISIIQNKTKRKNPTLIPDKGNSLTGEQLNTTNTSVNTSSLLADGVFASAENKDPQVKPVNIEIAGTEKNPSVNGKFILPESGSVSLISISSSTEKSKTNKFSKGIYLVLQGGPDWSAVDFQSIKATGFSLGILGGYRFNKHLSLEAGVLWDKKYYYSSGFYFKSKNPIPPTTKIQDLDGNCNMIEIPVGLRYDFSVGKNHRYFIKAGLSSYFMKKEYYNYNGEHYYSSTGRWYPYMKDTTYSNSTKTLFSILQISAGYEHMIGEKTKIRIEPYLKIPLVGVGYGSLPIASAGISLGISYSFQ